MILKAFFIEHKGENTIVLKERRQKAPTFKGFSNQCSHVKWMVSTLCVECLNLGRECGIVHLWC